MKKQDSKRIILSVLLGSMMWSNSLYAYTLTENISEDDIDKNTNFEEVIIAGNESGTYQPANGEKLTISGVTTDVVFTNVEKIENSIIEETVMGGYVENASNNELEISDSTIANATGGSGFSNVNNNIVTLDNTIVTTTVVGGLGTSDGGLLTGEIVDTITANGNKVTVNSGTVNNIYGGSVALIFYGSASNLEANNNTTIINNYGEKEKLYEAGIILGGTVTAAFVDIDGDVKWDSSNNTLEINDSYFETDKSGLLGGAIQANTGNTFSGVATANNNTINIKNSIIDAEDTSMGITAGYVSEVSSGEFTGLTSANENTINIENSTLIGTIIAGRNDKGEADGNKVTVTNSAVNGIIAGAFAAGSSASNNTVELNDINNLLQSSVFGWYGENPAEGFVHENNRLVINNFNGAVGGIANFNNMIFNDIEWNTDPSVEIVFDSNMMMPEYKVDGGILAIDISNIDAVEIGDIGNNKIETGDKAWLIFTQDNDSKNEIAKFDKQEFKNYTGVAKVVNGNLLYEDSVEMTLTGSYGDEVLNQTEMVGALSAVVKGVERNAQTDLVASNRAVAAAFINQGTDLIADSLDTLSRDGKYGVKTFAAVHGNRSKYDVNSDIKINGWSTIVGVGSETEHNGGDFSWSVFYENGSGNYRTFNSFNNEFFRGDGSLVYNGGGIAARYENAHGVYTEGSLRAGMLKSDMDNALSDGENKYGYSSESEYYGAHIGIGQIIPLSESSDLDVYGKFFHTYTEGDSFKVDTDEFEFDSINSDRLRVGARLTTNKENKFSTYYGLAYEYEFNGDAEMRAAGMSAPTQSLQGSSYMAEVGFNYQPTPESPWSFDLNMRGYAGERQGGSFNVQATYTF